MVLLKDQQSLAKPMALIKYLNALLYNSLLFIFSFLYAYHIRLLLDKTRTPNDVEPYTVTKFQPVSKHVLIAIIPYFKNLRSLI